VLYELLCGRLPFEGKMIEVLSKIVRGEFLKPRSLNPELSPTLEKMILTAMAHEKADRYPTAEAFQESLAGHLHTHAPTFSASQLTYLMMYLFEQELVSEGRPVQLPREFTEQVPLWRKKLPTPVSGDGALVDATGEPGATAAARPSGKLRPILEEDTHSESQ